MNHARTRRRQVGAVAVLTAAAAALRFTTLDAQSFTGDEAVTVLCFLDPGLGDALHALPESERTPPLYYVLGWVWAQLAGTGEVGARSLPALLGTAVVPVTYAAGAALVSRRAGLVAAAITTVHPLLVWYSQEARAYSLLVLLGALSVLFFARAIAEPGSRNVALWAAVSALALLTHYFAIFLIVPQAIWLLMTRGRRPVLPAIVAVGLTGLALLPLALEQEAAGHGTFITDAPLGVRLRNLIDKFLVSESGAPWGGLKLGAGLLVGAGLVLLLVSSKGKERRGGLIAGALALVAVAAPVALALVGADYFYDRNAIAALVPLSIAVAAGFTATRSRLIAPVAAGALCAVFATITVSGAIEEDRHRYDWREVARTLGPPRDGRVVLTTSGVGFRALKVYRPALRAMPPDGARANGLVAIGPFSPAAGRLGPPAAGFTRRGAREVGRLSVNRFSSSSPREVRPVVSLPPPLGSSRANNLVERPAADTTPVESAFCRSRWAEVDRRVDP